MLARGGATKHPQGHLTISGRDLEHDPSLKIL